MGQPALGLVEQLNELPEDITIATVRLLDHTKEDIRASAASVLGQARVCVDQVVQGLIKATDDDDEIVRAAAVRSLGKLRAPAGSAIPVLLPIIRREQGILRVCAIWAATVISPEVRSNILAALGTNSKDLDICQVIADLYQGTTDCNYTATSRRATEDNMPGPASLAKDRNPRAKVS